MGMPFTQDAFFEVFRLYNSAVFPWQIVIHALAFTVIPLMAFQSRSRLVIAARATGLILAALWAWMGAVYHIQFFAKINPAAAVFGAFFILQAMLFLFLMAWRSPSVLLHPSRVRQGVGLLMMVFGLLGYPVLNAVLGHEYFDSPTFGAPCPTTIFTIGLMLTLRNVHPVLWIVPIAWSFIGGSAAFLLGVPQDASLLVAGMVALVLLLVARRKKHTAS